MDVSGAGKFVAIPGVQAIAANTPDAAFARACDCIDKWLWKESLKTRERIGARAWLISWDD
jgi:hypothetical protein